MICESINVKVQVDDGVIIAVQNGCEVRVYIDLDTPILVGAFDWPPELDLLSTRVKQLEDNPATITVDNHLDDVSLNPVQNRTLWQIVQDIWAAINEFLQAIPTKVGQLQNDSGYITINDVPDSIFNQVGTEIKPIDPTATLDASFIANLPDPALDDTVTEESTKGVKSSGIWNAIKGLQDKVVGMQLRIINIEGSNITLDADSGNTYYRYKGASPITVTVPNTIPLALPFAINQMGIGAVTLQGASGVVLTTTNLTTGGQGFGVTVMKVENNLVDVIGGVE